MRDEQAEILELNRIRERAADRDALVAIHATTASSGWVFRRDNDTPVIYDPDAPVALPIEPVVAAGADEPDRQSAEDGRQAHLEPTEQIAETPVDVAIVEPDVASADPATIVESVPVDVDASAVSETTVDPVTADVDVSTESASITDPVPPDPVVSPEPIDSVPHIAPQLPRGAIVARAIDAEFPSRGAAIIRFAVVAHAIVPTMAEDCKTCLRVIAIRDNEIKRLELALADALVANDKLRVELQSANDVIARLSAPVEDVTPLEQEDAPVVAVIVADIADVVIDDAVAMPHAEETESVAAEPEPRSTSRRRARDKRK